MKSLRQSINEAKAGSFGLEKDSLSTLQDDIESMEGSYEDDDDITEDMVKDASNSIAKLLKGNLKNVSALNNEAIDNELSLSSAHAYWSSEKKVTKEHAVKGAFWDLDLVKDGGVTFLIGGPNFDLDKYASGMYYFFIKTSDVSKFNKYVATLPADEIGY